MAVLQKPATRIKTLSELGIAKNGRGLPTRVVLYGVEGIGKTSFPAFAPRPIYLQSRGETGLETLIDAGQLPEIDHFPEAMDWTSALGNIAALTVEDHNYKTLVLDTLNGLERLCHEYITATEFDGNPGEKGFAAYGRGYKISAVEWRNLLNALDLLREKRHMSIVALCHAKVTTFKNPEGADFDRYQADMHETTWSLTHKWSDIVLFYQYQTIVTESDPKKKGKGRGGQQRYLYTQRCAAFDAKNRHGLPEEIEAGDSAQAAWTAFITEMKKAKAKENQT